MSFKKTESNEVFLSDSFKSMPKQPDRDEIDVIEEHSQSGFEGDLSKPPEIRITEGH
jgi:hypothetical protein